MFTSSANPDNHVRFARPRLPCLAGYGGLPGIYTAMSFDLRHLPRVTSRVVKMEGHTYELWSPNSTQQPFFAGVPRSDWLPGIPRLLSDRRYDGHAGRHDCLYAPQYYRSIAKHWPFMRRVSMVSPGDYAELAYVPLTKFWQRDPANPFRGAFDPTFIAGLSALRRSLDQQMGKHRELASYRSRSRPSSKPTDWDTRPMYATEDRIARLLAVRAWDEAVDMGVAMQRGLREKEAWLYLFEARSQQRRLLLAELKEESMPLAKEKFIGVWINGADEELTLRYMRAGVPCFIVHEYIASAPTRELVGDVKVYADFLEGTEMLELLGDDNPYQRIARNQGVLDNIVLGDDGRGLQLPALAVDEMRSSSMFLEQLDPVAAPSSSPRAPSPRREVLPSAGAPSQAAPASDWRPYPRPPSRGARSPKETPWIQTGWSAPSSSHSDLPSLPPLATPATISSRAKRDRYQARPLEYQLVDPQRSSWIVPPPIQKAKDQGKWTKFELDEVHQLPAFVRRGAQTEVESSNLWYDRENKRRLYFGHFVPPAGVLDEDRFGAPVPRYPFFAEDGNKWAPQTASYWMYTTAESPRRNVGKRAVAPAPSRLPLLSGGSSGAEEEGKGKMKAAVASGYESEEGAYGMEVDEPDPAEAPSNVVVVDGLDAQISAVGFVRLARDAFYAGKATPLMVIRAQGRMWTRFENVMQGRGAFGALGRVAQGIEVRFRPEAEFEERAQYTTDVWYSDTDADHFTEDVPMGAPEEEKEATNAGSSAAEAVSPPPTIRAAPSTTAPLNVDPASPAPAPESPSAETADTPRASAPGNASAFPLGAPASPIAPPSRETRALPQPPVKSSARPPSAPRAMREATNWPKKLPLDARLTDAPASAPLLPPGPTTPLLRRMEGGVVPLTQRLTDPSLPLVQRLQSAPLLHRMSHAPVNTLGTVQDEELGSASDTDAAPKMGGPGKGKRKVRRGTRAGKLAKEQARLKAERMTATRDETPPPALPRSERSPVSGQANDIASSSSLTLEATAPSAAPVGTGMSWSQYTTEACESFVPPAQDPPPPPPAPESGPPGAIDPEYLTVYEEEEVALRWGNDEDDEDRPFAGPF
ncbi:hypothetical protein C8R47DRAFT_1227998 [Mycena vitilis]|nr:hypothetical protein C8R47DRAFT_1227998 [Mycena vitilis]